MAKVDTVTQAGLPVTREELVDLLTVFKAEIAEQIRAALQGDPQPFPDDASSPPTSPAKSMPPTTATNLVPSTTSANFGPWTPKNAKRRRSPPKAPARPSIVLKTLERDTYTTTAATIPLPRELEEDSLIEASHTSYTSTPSTLCTDVPPAALLASSPASSPAFTPESSPESSATSSTTSSLAASTDILRKDFEPTQQPGSHSAIEEACQPEPTQVVSAPVAISSIIPPIRPGTETVSSRSSFTKSAAGAFHCVALPNAGSKTPATTLVAPPTTASSFSQLPGSYTSLTLQGEDSGMADASSSSQPICRSMQASDPNANNSMDGVIDTPVDSNNVNMDLSTTVGNLTTGSGLSANTSITDLDPPDDVHMGGVEDNTVPEFNVNGTPSTPDSTSPLHTPEHAAQVMQDDFPSVEVQQKPVLVSFTQASSALNPDNSTEECQKKYFDPKVVKRNGRFSPSVKERPSSSS
ncbi:hypothetical protein EK21DRAFT_92719 [Setomelanomma holmii]|uniref:Uncharacterized protein n=1 Tax=Setomelanomma holmii TaxID=210430 RepID=A0A9P4H2I4_9PLEO|nr:hypothetical protein EK21DRAFT_92719 [Setomelanomma holmii]